MSSQDSKKRNLTEAQSSDNKSQNDSGTEPPKKKVKESTSKNPRPTHFEINASDSERCLKFYSNVFGWEFKKWEGGDPNNPYWLITTGKDDKDTKWNGINGGMMLRKGNPPKKDDPINGFVCTMDVPFGKLDSTIEKVTKNGGQIKIPKFTIPKIGNIVYIIDTEGNTFSIIEELPKNINNKE